MQRRGDYFMRMGLMLLLSFSLLAGCTRTAEMLDRGEERDPLIQRALAKKRTNDIDGAIEHFARALERNPGMARAHLELGVLYDGNKEDYIRAIYHYQRYLELRPNTEKKQLIDDLIRHARISFAATLTDQPSGAIAEIASLKKENNMLKQKLAEFSGELPPRIKEAPRYVSKTSNSRPATAPPPAPARPAVNTYVVQSGDTLTSVARKMYNDTQKWEMIYDANRATLKSPTSMRVGQTLVIPR